MYTVYLYASNEYIHKRSDDGNVNYERHFFIAFVGKDKKKKEKETKRKKKVQLSPNFGL